MPSYHNLTQGALIERLAAEHPDAEALVYPDRGLRLSFADLERRSMALARGLLALGVEPGDRVALWSDSRPDWIPLQFAIARVGAILVTANTALARDEIGYLLRQSRSRLVIAAPGVKEREYLDALEALRAQPDAHPELEHHVVLLGPGEAAQAPAGMLALDELVQRGEAVPAADVRARTAASHPDDRANSGWLSIARNIVGTP